MKFLRMTLGFVVAGAALVPSLVQAQASAYPSKPMKIIVAYSPGGALDGLARQLGAELTSKLGQAVIVDNRTGGLTIPAVQALNSAAPDGHTFAIFDTSTVAVNQFLFKRPPYDPEKFQPVAMIAKNPLGIVVRPDYPASNLKEFVAQVKAKPGTAFATPGAGTPVHLTMELFRQEAGLKEMEHVPYKGSAPAIQDLLAGLLPVAMLDVASSAQYIKAGKLKLLAVTTDKRLENFPQVPTIAESGYPGFSGWSWYAAYLPPKTSPALASELSAHLRNAITSPRVSAWLKEMSLLPAYAPPSETRAEVLRESTKFSKVVKDLRLTIDN